MLLSVWKFYNLSLLIMQLNCTIGNWSCWPLALSQTAHAIIPDRQTWFIKSGAKMKISKIAAGRFSHDCSILEIYNSSPNFRKILNPDKTSSHLRTLKCVDSCNLFLNFLTKWAPCLLCRLAKNQSNSLTGCAASVSRYAESLYSETSQLMEVGAY